MDELRAFIGVNFVMRYHKLPNLRSYWEAVNPPFSVNFVANAMTRKKFNKILGNLLFSNNEDVIPRDHPVHDRPIRCGFRAWYRCIPKIGYLYEFDIYTGKKETTEFGLGESVVVQLAGNLNGNFCRNFIDNFFTSPLLLRKLTDNSLY